MIPVQTTMMEIRVDQNPSIVASASPFGVLGLLCGGALFLAAFRRKEFRDLVLCCVLSVLGSASVGSLSGYGNRNQHLGLRRDAELLERQRIATSPSMSPRR